MFDCAAVHRHEHTDALGELQAWASFLQENGRRSVVVLGHSRATNQVSRYAASAPRPLGLVLVAPGVWSPGSAAARFAGQGGGDLAPLLAKARAMVESGRGDDVIGPVPFLHCDDATVSARSFASYYGDDPSFDTFALVERAGLPAIVVTGTEDRLTDGVADVVAGLAANAPVEHVAIDGADHFFRDLYAYDLVEAVKAWLERLVPR